MTLPDSSSLEQQCANSARRIVESNFYLSLATATPSGEPWICTLYYAWDSAFTFFWTSAKDSKHSQMLAVNSRAAATIYDSHAQPGTGEGVYLVGHGRELLEPDLEHALAVFYGRRYPDPSERARRGRTAIDFTGTSPRRLYALEPVTCYVLDPRGHSHFGSLVDVRIEVKLTLLQDLKDR